MEESFAVRRVALSAGARVAARPPYPCSEVQVINGATLNEIRVYSRDANDSYVGISAGFSHIFRAGRISMSVTDDVLLLECDTPETAVLVWVR